MYIKFVLMMICVCFFNVQSAAFRQVLQRVPNVRQFSNNFPLRSITDDIKETAKVAKEQKQALEDISKKLTKEAFTFEDFIKGLSSIKEKGKLFLNNFQLIDTEVFPRYVSGVLGGLTVYGIAQHKLEKPKRDMQEIYDLELEIKNKKSNLYLENEVSNLRKKLKVLYIQYIKNHGKVRLDQEIANIKAIEAALEKDFYSQYSQNNIILSDTVDNLPVADKELKKDEPVIPVEIKKDQPQQSWFQWGVSGLKALPYFTYNGLYYGVSYVAYPFLKTGSYLYSFF